MNTKKYKPQASTILLGKPYINGYMSVDSSREYHHDLCELKYVTSIPKGKLSYDLNHNIDKAIKRTTDENTEKISLLLRFLLDQRDRFKFLDGVPGPVTFITYRRTLINIMYSAFYTERMCIVATLFNNCIYLCSLLTPDEVLRKQSRSDQEKRYCAWGYKFEQYMCSDLPDLQPNIEKPVIENAEFLMYYGYQLGQHRLFYGAQIDGMLATDGVAAKPLDKDDVEANLNFLRSNKFVELKTNKEIQHWKQEKTLKKYKMLNSWGQCYLAGLAGLLVGYRSDEGIIQRLQWFDTDDIVNYCKHEWDPQTALNYLDYFLNYIENMFKPLRKSSDSDLDHKAITLQFNVDTYRKITVKTNVDDADLILPDWYVNKFNK